MVIQKSVSFIVTYARLITYFGNFVFGFSSCRLRDFLYNIFRLQGKMGMTKWKINRLLCNTLVTSSPKTTRNEITKMGWNAHYSDLNWHQGWIQMQFCQWDPQRMLLRVKRRDQCPYSCFCCKLAQRTEHEEHQQTLPWLTTPLL